FSVLGSAHTRLFPSFPTRLSSDLIVFALSIITLAGKGVPLSAKVFLVALATVDDLGAVLVIALFYSSELSMANLGIGFVLISVRSEEHTSELQSRVELVCRRLLEK